MSIGVTSVVTGGDGSGKKPKIPRRLRTPVAATTPGEAARVSKLLRRDRVEAALEAEREAATREVGAGRFANIAKANLGPTPEHAAKVPFEPFTADKVPGTSRSVETVRRVSVNRVKQLYDRGVFTDDTYPAVLWYQRQWEGAGFTLGASAASWGEAIAGERSYGAMPKSAMAAEARELFRFARGGRRVDDSEGGFAFEVWALPADMLPTFDLVVLHEMTIQEAATAAKCRYSNAAAAVKHVALLLSGRIQHLLPVRAVGAPGSEPIDAKDIDRLRKAEAVRDSTSVEGERQAAADAAERLRDRIGPIFFNRHGLLRPWHEIAEITRMRVAGMTDDEILAKLGDGE